MKVKELIRLLSKENPEAIIKVEDWQEGYANPTDIFAHKDFIDDSINPIYPLLVQED